MKGGDKELGLAREERGMSGRVFLKELDPWLLDVLVPKILAPLMGGPDDKG